MESISARLWGYCASVMLAKTLDEALRSWKTVFELPLIDLPSNSHLVASSSEYSSNKFFAVSFSFRVLRVPITPKACMKSAPGGMSSARKGCMESTRSVVCYQADEIYTLARDAIRDFVAITCQVSFVGLDKKLSNPIGLLNFLKAPPGIEPGIKVLQTSALPLGYGAEQHGLLYQTNFDLSRGKTRFSFVCVYIFWGRSGR